MYWPAFEFDYRLDLRQLLPHMIAIESLREAAASRVVPPPWREQPPSQNRSPSSPHLSAGALNQEEIHARKVQMMVSNTSKAQDWVRKRFSVGCTPLALDDILAMHRLIAEEAGIAYATAGVLRNSGTIVTVGRKEVGGIHSGAPEDRLPRLMNEYIEFVNSDRLRDMPPAMHALVAHFFFTTIHPFDDGNGRLSRLVSAGILFERGYNGHGFYALSQHFYQNDARYHTILHKIWREPAPPYELTEFVAFGMEGLANELQGINSFIKMKLHRTVD